MSAVWVSRALAALGRPLVDAPLLAARGQLRTLRITDNELIDLCPIVSFNPRLTTND